MTTIATLRTRGSRVSRREEIVRVASALINERGVNGFTWADIAARLGVVPTAVSYHFKRREDLAAACYMRAVDRFDTIIAAAEGEPTSELRLRRFLHLYFEFGADVREKRAEGIMLFGEARALNHPDLNSAYIAMFRRFRALLTDGVDQRGGIALNARAHLALAQIFWTTNLIEAFDIDCYPSVAERVLAVMRDGLGANDDWRIMTIERRSPRAPDAPVSREAFLDVATEIINSQGYRGASIDRISTALNVSKGSFYHHNSDKVDLIGECFAQTLATIRDAQRHADEAARSGAQNVGAVVRAMVEAQVSGVPLLSVQASRAVPEPLRGELFRGFQRIVNRQALVLSDGVADGSIRPHAPRIASEMVMATINGAAELGMWARGVTVENVCDLYVRPLFEGVLEPH